MSADVSAGLYVHVPFCLTRCGYCDFNTYAGLDHLASPYLDALAREATLAAPDWTAIPFVSVFFGGGTPTTLPPGELVNLLYHLRRAFAIAPDAEITVEANPDTVDEATLATLQKGGVTRLSIGVQSFDAAVLRSLERAHPPESARAAVAAARRAGFDYVNLDLIYGADGETDASWRRTLDEALRLAPEHLSCYALTVEPATPLGRAVAAGLVPAPDPDVQADRYAMGCEALGAAGYEHYEVSSWAQPGHRCAHNLGYWEGRPYLGLGAGAHSYRDGRRWWNVRPPSRYLELLGGGRLPVAGDERLCDGERGLEQLLLGLRTSSGVEAERVDPTEAGRLAAEGLATLEGGRVSLTERGLFLANGILLTIAGDAAFSRR